MNLIKNSLISFVVSLCLLTVALPTASCQAQDSVSSVSSSAKAKVIKIIDQRTITRDSGQTAVQQHLALEVLSGELQGQTIEINSIGSLDVVSANSYQVGDKVYLNYSQDANGVTTFYITDFDRTWILFLIAGLFCLIALLIGGAKGLKSILSLIFSFAVIMKILIPAVNHGYNPLLVGIGVSFLMLLAIIYITEGWNRKAHLAVIAIFCGLFATSLLSIAFASWAKLTGMAQEDITYILSSAKQAINFHDLLLASFIIGTLGVLDDLVISQIETAQQIRNANPDLSSGQIFRMTMKVGRSHMGSMTNTLFLAYAGASFPLLMLININNPPFLTWVQAINNEEIATEIIRTFVGVIGLFLTVPISTWLASRYLKNGPTQPETVVHHH
jgi:uncharacterized membrane protein